jgi:hypothetical protein
LTIGVTGGGNFGQVLMQVDPFLNGVGNFNTECTQQYSSRRENLSGPCTTPPLLATDGLNSTQFPDASWSFNNRIVDGYNISGTEYQTNVCLKSTTV